MSAPWLSRPATVRQPLVYRGTRRRVSGTRYFLRAGFCWWGPEANIEDGSSLIIHWSSGSHKRSTNWANQYDIYFGGGPGPWPPGPPKSALSFS